MDWLDGVRRWGRGAAALALLGALWVLAGPKPEAGAPAMLAGPGLGTARGAGSGSGPGGASAGSGGTTPSQVRRYVVHVAGAVRRPGVYRVRAPGRLIDAVERAGGLTADADLTQVNLAARLTDGRQIVVPSTGGGAGMGGVDAGAGAPSGASASAGGGAAASGAKVSLNSATAEQLQTLDGVGPAMAAAIIQRRTELGGFTRIEQLDEVPGVGEKRLASLKGQLDL